jgi:ribosomal protein L4
LTYSSCLSYTLKNARKHTASTKQSEVRGRPWKQKERVMRAGSRRSPLWVGGGYFRTKPRIVSKRLKKKKIAILSAYI